MKLFILAILLLTTIPVYAQSSDEQNYCAYTTAKAEADATILKYPTIVAGAIQPNTGTQPQLYGGVSQSISNWRKAALIRRNAAKDCALYISTEDVTLKIQYSSQTLERETLYNRTIEIDRAVTNLNKMYADLSQKVDAGIITVQQIYAVQSARDKLQAERSDAIMRIASLNIPTYSDIPIKILLSIKWKNEQAKQEIDEKLAKADNWDVSLEAGSHQQLNPWIIGRPGMYGTFTFTYKLGSKKRNRSLDQANRMYMLWKYNQQTDAVQQAALLRNQLQASLHANEEQSIQLQTIYQQLESKLTVLAGLDTKEAIAFGSQLAVDKTVLNVEIANTSFRISQLKQFLQDNL